MLDDDLPAWVPVPAWQKYKSLEKAVADITEVSGFELKQLMRTGTVATVDNRNWELRDNSGPVHRLSQSRAVALDMESATIAANGYRFRVPYGTLLCVSDKPLHGELKLPGMASSFYNTQVSRHLLIKFAPWNCFVKCLLNVCKAENCVVLTKQRFLSIIFWKKRMNLSEKVHYLLCFVATFS